MVHLSVALTVLVRPLPARAATCSLGPGKDGSPGTLSGAYNTYYKPPSGTLTAGSTIVPLGTLDTAGGGANTAVAANDLVLIVQMQDGSFGSTNASSYGDGSGSGYTSIGQAGLYEYVSVQSVAGGSATIVGTGAGGGLINSYVESAANGSHGQQTYQILRVPQFVDATLSSTFHAAYWDGKTGGVAALDVASTLNLGGAAIYATGDGFRGGGLTVASSTPAAILNSDWAVSATMNGASAPGQGAKGEGFLGTPDYLFGYTNFSTPSTPSAPAVTNAGADGYPGGDMARGAPGNAGGGGTDMDPAANDQNSGGGGGANGGSGGTGGYPWTPNYTGSTPKYAQTSPGTHTAGSFSTANSGDMGGRGGAAAAPSATRLFLGGGGGAGTNNNGSNNNPSNAYGSSGGVGGGIVLLRIADTSGSAATIYADGTTGLAPDNDGGGGGGAGGTVVITSPNTFSGITVHADGAQGTTAAATASDTSVTIQHGPGGGGGGGVVLASSPVAATVNGGANGTTTTAATSYGATSGASGVTQSIAASQIPGVASGAECYAGNGGGTILTGPRGAYNGTGSYDGSVPATNNNDFTAQVFVPTGAPASAFANSDTTTTPMVFTGAALPYGPTTIDVPNEFRYSTGPGVSATITLNATAPTVPGGWTMQICRDNAGAADCVSGAKWTIGAAGSSATSTYAWPRNTTATIKYWAVYTAPVNVVAYTRYDAVIGASDSTTTNFTHNELYAGFLALKKTLVVQSTGCPAGQLPGPTGACPGGLIIFRVDYKNLAASGLNASSLVITEPGANGSTSWPSFSNGLNDVLQAGASVDGTSVFGCTTAGTTFTGNAIGAAAFTASVGGGAGLAPGASGTLYFRVKVK